MFTFLLQLLSRELKHGIPITDENDNRLGESTTAAKQAISQVVVSRILMASPGMGTYYMIGFRTNLATHAICDSNLATP